MASGPSSLLDRALGVELGGDVRATDERVVGAHRPQAVDDVAARLLAGADDDGVDVEHLRLPADANVQAASSIFTYSTPASIFTRAS